MKKTRQRKIRNLLLTLLFSSILFNGCAYYNTFYNAKKFYREASKEREKRLKTQVVELSAEEKAKLRKTGRATETQGSKPGTNEMQNYQRAIERSLRVIKFYPDSKWIDDALMLVGQCYYHRQEYTTAKRKFDELLQLYPDSEFAPEAELMRARTLIGLENVKEAENALGLIANEKKFGKKFREIAKYELGTLYYNQENYELAAENYRSTARGAEDKLIEAMSLYRLGECLLNLKQYEEAPAIFKRAVRESPNEDFKSQSSFKLGEAYTLVGDHDKAIKTFSDLLSKEFEVSRIPKIKYYLAKSIQTKGDIREAINWYEDIIDQHKRTDASARSYWELAKIEEYINGDYKKAKENYDLVRAEFSTSIIVPEATQRSNDIGQLLDLRKEIDKLEGRAVETDSTEGDVEVNPEDLLDNGPIDLGADGLWFNYAGRDRPPPTSLLDLTEADLARAAAMQQRQQAQAAAQGDTTTLETQPVALDSAAIAKRLAEAAAMKGVRILEKKLALAQVLLFSFDMPDSAIKYFNIVKDENLDSTLTAHSLYSLAFIYRASKGDTTKSDSLLNVLLEKYPESKYADGAKATLGIKEEIQVDLAQELYFEAETLLFSKNSDVDSAIVIYNNIEQNYPDSPYAARAAFAKAWHLERSLFMPDSARSQYKYISETYKESEFGTQAKKKLDKLDAYIKAEEARQKALADSLAKKAQADSLQAIAGDSLGTAISLDSLGLEIQSADSLKIVATDSTSDPESTEAVQDTTEELIDELDFNLEELQEMERQNMKKFKEPTAK